METKKKLRRDIEYLKISRDNTKEESRRNHREIGRLEDHIDMLTRNAYMSLDVSVKDVITEILSQLNLDIVKKKDNKNFELMPSKKVKEGGEDGD